MRKMAWLYIGLLLFTILPFNVSNAAEPLQISAVSAIAGDNPFSFSRDLTLNQNSTANHGTQMFRITFNRNSLPGKATLKDQDGNAVPLNSVLADPTIVQFSTFTIEIKKDSLPLKPKTAYSLTIHGGLDGGWKDSDGNPLPDDVTFLFTTDDSPIQYRFEYDPDQPLGVGIFNLHNTHPPTHIMDIYRFTAGPGDILVGVSGGVNDSDKARIAVIDPVNQSVVYETDNQPLSMTSTVTIPHRGQYDLYVQTTFGKRHVLFAQGQEIRMERMSEATFWNVQNYETHNSPFDIKIERSNADHISILLDGQLVKTVNPAWDDRLTAEQRTVDPANLHEGLHRLTFVLHHDNGNKRFYVRDFIVDRIDSFQDVPQQFWAHHYVEAMQNLRIVSGRSPNRYEPQATITRAEFVKLIAKSLGVDTTATQDSLFLDVPADAWYTPYVETLRTYGLVRGEEIGGQFYFHPDRPITRAEAAVMILNAEPSILLGTEEAPLKDLNEIPSWAKRSVVSLYHAKWMIGYEDDTFRPLNHITRAEAAALIARLLGM